MTSTDKVLDRLDDPQGDRYTRDAVQAALNLGSDTLLRRTEILWDIVYFDAVARTGNVTSRWEQVYLLPNTQATFYCGLLNYTGGHWEHEFLGPAVFMNGAAGPVQVTSPWEALGLYHPEVIDQEVFEVPERLVRVDRVTWNYRELDPQTGNSMRRFYGRFKDHESGDPRFFIFNEDGLRMLRVSPVMPATGTIYTYSGTRGLLRNTTEGELVEAPSAFADLAHYWKAEESSGSRLDSFAGSPDLAVLTTASQVAGKNNYAVKPASFDEAPGLATATAFPTGVPWSISLWIKIGTGGGASAKKLFGDAATGNNLFVQIDTDKLSVNSTAGTTTGATSIALNVFHHVVLAHDGVSSYKLYLNGALEISHSVATSAHKLILYGGF